MSTPTRQNVTELCAGLAKQSVDAIRRDIYGGDVIEVNPVGAARLMVCIFDTIFPAMLRLSTLPQSDARELIMGVLAVPNTHPKLVEIAERLREQL
jgi:hypothetical protein